MVDFDVLHAYVGKRIRYREKGMAPTHRLDPKTGEVSEASYVVIVEGEVIGFEVDSDWSGEPQARLKIAGYGLVPLDECAQVVPTPTLTREESLRKVLLLEKGLRG